MPTLEVNSSGGFDKTTNFKWLAIGLALFAVIAFMMPMPASMSAKAEALFSDHDPATIALKATHMKIIIALLAACVVFFATETTPLPAVALIIGLVQLFFGITPPEKIVSTYAHDAVWFIAGSLAIGATLVKYGLDKRIGMLVVSLSGTKTRMVVFGIILGTAIPAAFMNESSTAPMFIPIALALYSLTNKIIPAPNLGKLLMISVAVGCMVGTPMSPTGGARNAIMIGFLSNIGIDVSFVQWISMGVFFTVVMAAVMSFILPLIFKPEVNDLSDAVTILRGDLHKHGKMTTKQWLVAAIMILVVYLWITDKSITRQLLGFSLGLGGVAITGVVLYLLLGLASWKDYERNVSWGVIILYAGAVSLGTVFESTGAASWLAESIIALVAPLGIKSGIALIFLVVVLGAGLTNLMSAGATVVVIGPVVLDMAQISGTNPLLVGIALAISTSMAYWLVVGTPASSIVYSRGQLQSKDFIRMATVAWPIALIVIAIMITLYWVAVLRIPVFI
ncbi:MAG: DASS family sodium-coupled anion symporter [Fidelibacterota bacterium]|nr:MAG: DASS family sodium-coupled anion symporter [Candidatus Neomarinimicrobiota bacterium]